MNWRRNKIKIMLVRNRDRESEEEEEEEGKAMIQLSGVKMKIGMLKHYVLKFKSIGPHMVFYVNRYGDIECQLADSHWHVQVVAKFLCNLGKLKVGLRAMVDVNELSSGLWSVKDSNEVVFMTMTQGYLHIKSGVVDFTVGHYIEDSFQIPIRDLNALKLAWSVRIESENAERVVSIARGLNQGGLLMVSIGSDGLKIIRPATDTSQKATATIPCKKIVRMNGDAPDVMRSLFLPNWLKSCFSTLSKLPIVVGITFPVVRMDGVTLDSSLIFEYRVSGAFEASLILAPGVSISRPSVSIKKKVAVSRNPPIAPPELLRQIEHKRKRDDQNEE
jgi:hypothetical protein